MTYFVKLIVSVASHIFFIWMLNILRRSNMTYLSSNERIVKSGIWTHALSQELELESSALDRSAILTLFSFKTWTMWICCLLLIK